MFIKPLAVFAATATLVLLQAPLAQARPISPISSDDLQRRCQEEGGDFDINEERYTCVKECGHWPDGSLKLCVIQCEISTGACRGGTIREGAAQFRRDQPLINRFSQ